MDERGHPIGVAEIVVVGAMEKLGADGVTNIGIRGVADNAMSFRPEVKHRQPDSRPRPGSDEAIVGAPHPRPHSRASISINRST